MPWWSLLIAIILSLIAGGIIGFVITKSMISKELEKNPPISENQIRVMYRQMGRKPSETDIKKVMNAMKRAKK